MSLITMHGDFFFIDLFFSNLNVGVAIIIWGK